MRFPLESVVSLSRVLLRSSLFFLQCASQFRLIFFYCWHIHIVENSSQYIAQKRNECSSSSSSSVTRLWKNIKLRSFWLTRESQVCQLENQSAHGMCYTHTHEQTNSTIQFFLVAISRKVLESAMNSTLRSFDDDPRLQAPLQWFQWIVCCS